MGSIYNMLKRVGGKAIICSKVEDLDRCEKIILPGVGSLSTFKKKKIVLQLKYGIYEL
tara:strand:+ start:1006 stop:1179 length:174 start_codon:yes stop_codon:yes gene_type:complete